MRDLDGNDIGTTIRFRSFGLASGSNHEATHPWPEETAVSAGNGVVIVRNGQNYQTLFMEAYPPGASFIRGEGETPKACEDAAWAQYQKALHCPSGGEHEWVPRNRRGHAYWNGAGFCKNCWTFKSQTFTAEELGAFCSTCGTPANWSMIKGSGDLPTFGCKLHPVDDDGRWLLKQADRE